MSYAVLTHGGVASPAKNADGCEAAARLARAALDDGGDAVRAALVATASLEDDPRFNAGTGSNLRLDGELIEMDAAVMGSDGRFGAVACIQRVRNPILVAARVTETPHLLLVGEGATAFARRHGFTDYNPTTAGARAKYARALAALRARGDDATLPWTSARARAHWNFEDEPVDCDTVGAVVRDASGAFAATASTGGTTYTLRGRVGDSPLMGAGVFAGLHGAVAATGTGEEIVRRFLAKTIYDWLAAGVGAEAAADRGIALFPETIDVGVLVVGRASHAIRANREMAAATISHPSSEPAKPGAGSDE